MSNKVLSKPTQIKAVLEYLEVYGSMTAYQAIHHCGILSFSRRICDLKELKYIFEEDWVTGTDRRGKPYRTKRFRIEHYPAKADENGQFQIGLKEE